MADYDSSLPVRSEADGTDERLHCKIVDGSTPAQMATVDTDLNLHVEVHGNSSTGDETLLLSELGATVIDGVYDGTNNTDPANIGLIAHVRNSTPADANQTLRVTGIQGTDDDSVWAQDVSLHDGDGDAYTNSNPLPVSISSATIGDAIFDYNTAASVAKDASDTHTYTVTAGKTLTLASIQASASGKMKIEVKTGASGSTVATLVMFNSTANPNLYHHFEEDFEVAATNLVEIVRTNLDNQAQDLYSLIEGEEN